MMGLKVFEPWGSQDILRKALNFASTHYYESFFTNTPKDLKTKRIYEGVAFLSPSHTSDRCIDVAIRKKVLSTLL